MVIGMEESLPLSLTAPTTPERSAMLSTLAAET